MRLLTSVGFVTGRLHRCVMWREPIWPNAAVRLQMACSDGRDVRRCCTVRADFFLDEEIQWQQERGLFDHSSMFRVAVRIKACASWLSSSSPLHPNPLLHTYRTINHLSRIAGMSTSRTVTKRVLSVETEEVRGTIQFILMEGHILKPLSA